MEKTVKIPGPEHPIEVRAANARVVVTAGGRVVADSVAALVLQESRYPPVYYIPRGDADMTLLTRSTHTTYCPYKGDCAYYSIGDADADAEGAGRDAVWTYEAAYPAVAAISGHLAFYPERVDAITVTPLA